MKIFYKNGNEVAEELYCFNKEKNSMTTEENNVAIITVEDHSTQTAGNYSTQTAGFNSTQTARNKSTQIAEGASSQTAGFGSNQTAGSCSSQRAGFKSTQTAGFGSNQTAESSSSQTAGFKSIQTAGFYSTQTAGGNSSQTAGNNSICISNYLTRVTAKGENVIAIRRDELQTLILNNQTIQWCPKNIKGYVELINDKWYLNGKTKDGEYIIVDGILSEVVQKKGNVYKVINYRSGKVSFLIKNGEYWAHGDTFAQAKESLMYKMLDKDNSGYRDYTLDTILTKEELIRMYRTITGSCESGVRDFVKNIDLEKASIKEVMELTSGAYGGEEFSRFFTNGE